MVLGTEGRGPEFLYARKNSLVPEKVIGTAKGSYSANVPIVSRLAWEHLGVPPEELEEVAGVRDVWVSLLKLLPPRPDPRRSGR